MLAALAWIARRRHGLTQIAVVLAAVGVYESARIAITPDWTDALHNARQIWEWERALRMNLEEPIQQAFLAIPDAVEALNVFYFVGHFLLTAVFFLWLYRRDQRGFRAFRDGFFAATMLALVIHWQFPTAPPRLAGVGLIDTLRALSGIDIGSRSSEALSNPVFAVPSLHAGYAAGVGAGLVLYARRRWLRILGFVYPLLVVLTIVVTGNHFLFDAVAGLLVMAVGFGLAALVGRLWERGHGAILEPATRGGAVR
ncbi:MAG: phosphatase PAP2 family protein [Pseudomonadota bacterium]